MEKVPSPKLPKVSRRVDPQSSGPRKTFKSLFLLSCVLAAVFMMIFWGVGWMASDDAPPEELFARVQDGTKQNQRIAALAWSQKLREASLRGDELKLARYTPNFNYSERLSSVLKERMEAFYSRSSGEDLLYLSSLIEVLSYSSSPNLSWPTILGLLADSRRASLPVELRVSLVLGLSRLSSRVKSSIPSFEAGVSDILIEESKFGETTLKTAAAYTMGLIFEDGKLENRENVRNRLRELLNDSSSEVRWNAGFALGRWGDDPSVYRVLMELVDLAEDIEKSGKIANDDSMVLTEALLQALDQSFRVSVLLSSREGFEAFSEITQKIAVISKDHPHLKIRQAALAALKLKN